MALRVVHTQGRNAGGTRTLNQDVVRIGRGSDNDVAFDAQLERMAGVHHAEVRRDGDAWILIDLDSINGTWIAGRRIDHHEVVSGDEVMFGESGPRLLLTVVDDPACAGDVPPLPRSGSDPPPPTERVARTKTEPGTDQAAASDVDDGPLRNTEPGDEPPEAAVRVDAETVDDPYGAGAPGATVRDSIDSGHEHDHAAAAADGIPAPPPTPRVAVTGPPTPFPPSTRGDGPTSGRLPMAPPAGSGPGTRTIGEMISHAMRDNPVSAYVEDRLGEHRRTTRVLGGLLLLSLVCVVALIIWNARSQRAIERLQHDLTSMGARDRSKAIAGAPSTAAGESLGRQLYDKYKKGIFMLAAGGHGFCTAFAVRPNVLATNAHCAEHADQQRGEVIAVENEGRGRTWFHVTSSKAHPWFHNSRNEQVPPDVGVVYISGRAATVLALATPTELTHLGAGDEIFLLGFPGRLMDAQNPQATFLAAHIGRVTNPHGQPGTFAQTWLIEHDAQTTPGTSGSPIFDAHGKVMAINEGSYTNQDHGESGQRDSPYKIAIRIDLLNQLLQ